MSDLTFITNEKGETLLKRFSDLVKNTSLFDCLVGYFYTSGFYSLYKSLETTEKIRVLIGISTDKKTFEIIEEARNPLLLSSKEIKDEFSRKIVDEMADSKDTADVEEGVKKFIEWLKSDKLEIKAFPTENLHAKLYIMTFKEGNIDFGRVITGSSNFTEAGLRDNLEFNVELKNRSDYEFSIGKFNELWKNAIDISEKYVETIKKHTWLNDEISPYHLYLKFLYEYLKEKINIDKQELDNNAPKNIMDLEYQKDAVRDAKMKLEEYGGVFLSDVVGLGKTYIGAMLARELDGSTLVIAPPTLLDKNNPGSWKRVFFDLGVRSTEYESIGQLDQIIKRGTDRYNNVIIDEAHRFRTEQTQMYEKLFQICRGKRVILVSATPLNNTPMDILSQIKLFQNAHKSTLPNPKVRNLERYFKSLQNKLKGLDRQKDKDEYIKIIKENAEDIRQNVLQYLMVRRTRSSIIKYYEKDLQRYKLKFPDVEDPRPIIYNFDENLDKIFNQTVESIATKFKYSRYTPLLYLKEELTQPEELAQKNMGKFMKVLLLKRLESSFDAFRKSIHRFIHSYTQFIKEYEKGNVYVSKKYINKVFELLEDNDIDTVQRLIEEEKAKKYNSKDFKPEFLGYLKNDLSILTEIENLWSKIESDPKLEKLIDLLKKDQIIKNSKLLIFTESKETADYLGQKLDDKLKNKVLVFSSASSANIRSTVTENFDPRARIKKDDYKILISTEVLSEGVNLHRANVVINYDIPWNPTRMMQRVGRINRVNSKFDKIYTYNFFPASPINKNISLKEAAIAKIQAFIEMLGNDARLLTDEEIKSHDLFMKLTSKEIITGEDEEDSELKYLVLLREIRDKNKELFEKIKKLPKKARTAKRHNKSGNEVITFFRKGKLRKIFITDKKMVNEVDFLKAIKILESRPNTKKEPINREFYEYLDSNKKEFNKLFLNDQEELINSGGRSQETKFFRVIKAIERTTEFTEEDDEYIQKVLALLEDGALPKQTIKKILKSIEKDKDSLKILNKIRLGITPEMFRAPLAGGGADTQGPKEIILSEYLIGGD